MQLRLMKFEKIEVSAYSGYKLNEHPVSFRFRGNDYSIVKVIDRWYEGTHVSCSPCLNYFKVKAGDGKKYILRYNSLFDVWSIMIYD